MLNQDLRTLLNTNSIIIDSGGKAGKITFLFYLVEFFYKSRAIVFTPQDSYLFYRRIEALTSQFPQFENLKSSITPYFLNEDFNFLKQKYGYDFFLKELLYIITTSEEEVIVMHRIGEYFEFQDRYEIENIYKMLIKTAIAHKKKMIFLANNLHENYEMITQVAGEFTDVSISIKNNADNERILNIKDILHHKEYPLMQFKIHEQNFILDLYEKSNVVSDKKNKHILIAELDKTHDNMRDICNYIFDKPNFRVSYANSLSTILQEIFIVPDIVIVLMKREQKNFDTISAIKKQLPDTKIIAIVDQNFVRVEDAQEAYNNGCDELFANNLSLEGLILVLQKSSKTLFYTESINSLPKVPNIMTELSQFKELSQACIDKSIFFTAFTIESKNKFEFVRATSRNSDYIYQTDHKIYYLALSTMPKDIIKIINNYREKDKDLSLTCLWEPINHNSLDSCIS